MAKYLEKTEADLVWNELRREVQMRVNVMAAHWRDRKLNAILPTLQEKFEQALNEGTLLALDPGSEDSATVIKQIVKDVLSDTPDA